MRKPHFDKYLFEAKHHSIHNNVYSLKLAEGYVGNDAANYRAHLEMNRLNYSDNIEINLNNAAISIYSTIDGLPYRPEILLPLQFGNCLMGKDVETNRSVLVELQGIEDNNGLFVLTSLSLQYSDLKYHQLQDRNRLQINSMGTVPAK
ncbi:hypothetical protein ABIB62_000916 [Mucilaginibacter sp. UYP25]|uniref:hypothetical protein n=1 Tax=unclassified Mucilaginibacter TaxID=2617802 RepID=UPI0033921678